jgi:tetratricopeptide (TPR) repeat protein
MDVLQSRRKLIIGIAGVVVAVAIIWAIVAASNPYRGLETERRNNIDDTTREIVGQRLELSLAALEAQKDVGDVELDLYTSVIFDAWVMGDLVLARETSEEYFEHNDINYAAWNMYGAVLKEMGDLEGAEDAYMQAIQLNPNVEEYYRDLINVISEDPERSGDVKEALETLIENAGQSSWSMVTLGEWYRENGECDEAIAHYKVAAGLAPELESIQADLESLQKECAE